MSTAFLLVGFVLVVAGLAAWSVPAACVVAGLVLFIAGGLEQARNGRSTP